MHRPDYRGYVKCPRTFVVSSLILYLYVSGAAVNRTPTQQQACAFLVDTDFIVFLLGAFFRTICYSVVDPLAPEVVVQKRQGFGTLLRLPGLLVEQWIKRNILSLILVRGGLSGIYFIGYSECRGNGFGGHHLTIVVSV